MFKDIRNQYAVKTCPLDDAQGLELLLNTMAFEGWDLYTMNEAETPTGKACYNCIFVREIEILEEQDNSDIGDLKSPLEKMFETSDAPYNQCLQIQRKIKEKKEEIKKIKQALEVVGDEKKHQKLNKQIAEELRELKEMKLELSLAINPEKMFEGIETNKITIMLSEELSRLTDTNGENLLLNETVKSRQKLTEKLGFVLPYVKFDSCQNLEPNEFTILIRDIEAYKGTAFPGYRVFDKDGLTKKPKSAIASFNSITLEENFWVEESKTKDFWNKGKSTVEFIVEALEFITVKNADSILDYSDINNYMDLALKKNHYLVDSLIPEMISIGEIRTILAQLISSYVSVRDIVFIFEKINDYIGEDEEIDILTELRIGLARQISAMYADENREITVIMLGDKVSKKFESLIYISPDEEIQERNIEIDIKVIQKVITNIMKEIKENNLEISNTPVITSCEIRDIVHNVLREFIPQIRVLAREEIAKDFNLNVVGVADS
ncbi:MAG: FHIPEP family type III secretion protein [Candidatus Gastranaerophilales bacterium]|nr:FHIPEP family type III secretion protein [Candidatus Gastranaerophilales bacterium]